MSGVKDLVPTWGSSRPWLGTREQIAAGQFPGISVGSPRGTELASYQGGQVVVKDSWFAQPEGARRAILYHEAGHGLADAALLGTARHGLDSPLDLLGWPKASWLGHNYDEIVAEAYSVIWTEPQWFDDDDKRAVRDLVIALAREHGYPLPPSVRTASGTLTAGASAMSLVYRGLPLFIDSEQDARSLLSGGGAAAAVLLRLVADDGLGVWWTSSAGEAYSHAETTSGDYDLSVEGAVAAADRGEGYYGAETPVVLTANAPTVWEDDDWRVAEGSDIDLVSVKYSTNPMDDTAWIEVPVGRRLTASAAGLPSGIRFEHIPHYQQGLDGLSASLGGGEVGLLLWQRPRSSPWDGEIYSAWVDEDYRRQGIATEMLARAREIEPTVHHSDTLSDEGRAWAEKVGSYSERRGTKIGTYKEFDLHHENHGSTENIWAYLTNDLRGPGWEKYAVGNLRWWNDQGPSYGVAPGMIEWVEVKDPHKHKGLASEMLRLAREIQPNVHHSTNLTPAGTGWSQRVGSVPGVVFEHEESRSEYGGTVTTDPRMVAYDGEREVGALDWDARDPRLFGTVKVDPAYRGRGIATRLYEEAKAVNPDLDPETSVFFTPAGRGWVDSLRTASFNFDEARSARTASGVPARLWHSAPQTLRGRIEAEGLVPQGTDPDDPMLTSGIWTFSDQGRMSEVSQHSDVWEIDASGLAGFEHGSEASSEWYEDDPVWVFYGDSIPASRVRRVGRRVTAVRKGAQIGTHLDYTLHYVPGHRHDNERIFAYHADKDTPAANLRWDHGVIEWVHVGPEHRRRGLASAMLDKAREIEPNLQHSTSLTDDGKAFVNSLERTAMPDELGYWYHFGISLQRDVEGQYVHLGTAKAARDRMNNTRQEGRRPDGTFYRAKIHPRNPLGSLSSPLTDAEVNILLHWEGTAQRPGEMPSEENDGHEPPWFYPANSPTPMDIAARLPYRGAWMHDAYFYTNTVEDPGSVSVAIDPDVITEDDIAPPFNESVGPGQLLLWGSRGPMATWEDMDQARPGPGQHLPEVGTPHVASRTDMLDPRDNLRSTMPAKTAVLDVCPECGSSDVSIVDYSDNLHECGACTAMWDSTTVWGSRSDYEHWLHEGRRLAARKTATAFESLSDEGRGWARGMDDAELRDEWDAALRLQDRFPDQTDPVDEILPLAEEAQRRGIALPGWNPTDPRFAPRAPEFDPDEGRVPREDPDDRRERMRWGSRKTPLVMGKTQRVASTERDLGDGWKATREGDQGRSKANRVWRVTHDGEYQGIVETLTQARHMKDRGPRNTSALRSLALGETVVPAEVDTLRDSACPVCGTADYRGTRCNSCGYVKPPVIFDDPNVEKAKEVDSHAPREVVDLACDHCGTGFPAESLSTTAARKDDDEDEDDIPYPDEDDEEDEDSAEDAYPDDEGVQDLDDDDADGDADDDGEDPDDEEEGDVPEVVQEDPGSDDEGDEDTDIQPDDEDDESSDDVEEAIDEARDDDGEVDPEDEGEPAEETGTEDGLDLSVGDICPDCGVGTLLPKDEIDGVESSQNLPSDPEGQQERMDGPTDGPDQKESMMSTTSRGETRNPRSETFTGASNPVQQRLAAQNRAHRAQMRAMEERTGRQIGVLAQQNEMLRSAVASLAEEMGPAGRRVAASLGVRLAESDAPTNDADAAAPEATDDVESPGKAPDAVNDDITADGTTDVESTDVVLAETELTDLENVLEETPQVQSEDKTVHHREPQPSADGRAEQANRIEDSGWTTASKEDGGKEGQWASLRVAQLRIKAGVETEDEIVLAQRIATQMTVEQMQVEANALERVLAASKGKPAPRNLVPQSTGGGTPSLARRSTASTDDADEGVPDVSDSFGV